MDAMTATFAELDNNIGTGRQYGGVPGYTFKRVVYIENHQSEYRILVYKGDQPDFGTPVRIVERREMT